jgi:hypothetical protein
MKAELFIDGNCFNCFRGGYVSYNDVQSRQNPLEIAFMAEGHYGEVKCGVKLMTISGKEETFYFGGYDDELVCYEFVGDELLGDELVTGKRLESFGENACSGFQIVDVRNIKYLMIFLDSGFGYADKFHEVFPASLGR